MIVTMIDLTNMLYGYRTFLRATLARARARAASAAARGVVYALQRTPVPYAHAVGPRAASAYT